MKSGRCPKCGSTEVHAGTRIAAKGGVYGSNTIPLGSLGFSSAALDNYVCVTCGYVESYVADRWKLEKIARKWPQVEGSGKP
jgi:predicted nucleic-acid-binding Zn-ribbon protein